MIEKHFPEKIENEAHKISKSKNKWKNIVAFEESFQNMYTFIPLFDLECFEKTQKPCKKC